MKSVAMLVAGAVAVVINTAVLIACILGILMGGSAIISISSDIYRGRWKKRWIHPQEEAA